MSWVEAQGYCRAEYGDLATISSENTNSRIHNMTKDLDAAFWIGLYDDVNSWNWSLVGEQFYDGVRTDFRQWQAGQPDNAGSVEHCASMTEDGLWRDYSCTLVKRPLICFRDKADDQYVLVTETKTWFEAQSYCRQHYTDLVSVRSPAENEELTSRLQGNAAVQEAWIGLRRDAWKWSDGSSSSFRWWCGSQPDNENNTQACVNMQRGRWNDSKCETSFNFLCQRITEVTPAPLTEYTTIKHGPLRRTTVKMRILTDANLKDPTTRQPLLQQLEAELNIQGSVNVRLLSLRTEPQPQNRDECGQVININ
uniref:C-type lectin domain-containing protein n=1 Tax=Lates calcarifer TaxID=8187 RepID=A0A4W6CI18_LATCA